MGAMKKWAIEKAIAMTLGLIAQMTPAIRDMLAKLIRDLYAKALTTDNPIDDGVVELIAEALQINLDGVTAANEGA